MLGAGLQPVREEDEVAPLNTYLRWLPCMYNPAQDRKQWYTQLMFAQHAANISPTWGRSRGTGHPGITMFNRGGGLLTFDPFNRSDRQMNAHLFLFGPTGSGKSATSTTCSPRSPPSIARDYSSSRPGIRSGFSANSPGGWD